MMKPAVLLFTALSILGTATTASAYGKITGKLQPAQEPFRCAAFVYPADMPPPSPYSTPIMAAPCSPDGSFSITAPAGRYILGTGVSLGGIIYATQPAPDRRVTLSRPGATIVILRNEHVYDVGTPFFNTSPGNTPAPVAANETTEKVITITGTVRDDQGQPISNAVVKLLDPSSMAPMDHRPGYLSTPTDSAGLYRIEGIAPKTYHLKAYAFDPVTEYNESEAPLVDLTSPERWYDLNLKGIPQSVPSVPAPRHSAPAQGASEKVPAKVTLTDPATL